MVQYYTDKEFTDLTHTLAKAVKDFNLVVFVGAGTSLSQGYPNWNGYIEKLIHFWQFNIQHVAGEEMKVTNELLSRFDGILNSNTTPKRKIDLLHTLLQNILGEDFKDVKLNFEEYFFKEVVPDYIENSVLVEMIKLDPIFITSNYDFEIERHLKRSKQKGTFKPINNIREFAESNNILRSSDVLHLHGTTQGNWDFFVNSSVDYSRQYLKGSKDFNSLSKWFEKKQPVVLFIGSSMEEEEILALLPATTKNFALMKANSSETQGLREIYNQTYQNNNNTTIFWYGDSYDDLPGKVAEIVKVIQNELETPESIDDWNTLHTMSTDDELFKEILEKHLEDERFLFDIFKADDSDLEEKILKNTLSSQVLLGEISNISSFWTMIDRKFDTLDEKQVQAIISIFQKQRLSVYWEEIFKVFEKLKESEPIGQDDINKMRRNLSQEQEIIETAFSSDADLMGYWLIEQLQKETSNRRSIFYDDEIISINLKSEIIPLIVKLMTDETRYIYWSFKEIISDELIRIIYISLLNDKMLLDNKSILDNCPDLLLESHPFQRILVSIDNEVGLNDSIKNKLITKIDFSNTIFGSELNSFSRKYKGEIEELGIEISSDYQDMIFGVESGFVHQKSFIDINQILSEDMDTILEILLPKQNDSSSKRKDFFYENTYQETSKFLLSLLNKNDEVSKKVKQIILEKGLLLYPIYDKLFVEILVNDTYCTELRNESLNIFLEKFSLKSFSWEEKKFFESLIDKEEFTNKAFEKLLQVNVNELNYDYVYVDKTRPELIEVNDFINTELGRYLGILIKLNKKEYSRRSELKNIISQVNSKPFREFSQGALSLVNSSVDLEEITINTFQGYSYVVRGFQKESLEKFKSVSQELLKKGLVNDFNKDNLFILSLFMINPSDEEVKVNWSEINFSGLIDIILQNEVEFDYEEQWIKNIILKDEDGQYGMKILHSIARDLALIDKSKKLVDIFEETINRYAAKIKFNLFLRAIEKQDNPQKKDLLIRFFFLLLDNAKLAQGYFGSGKLADLMKQLDPNLQKKLAKHSKLSTILSPLEIENLKREIE
ncbi:SIR2 family protein [Listeria cossartiae]|uniref:SIR2 family protein n=1 Tax=Listeria cossartiae TaxID=2838249 RepID=UPI0028808B00|nr:SIR2 family protein [Listeria cossartiae]MDT0015284.1 SIR2 family protein [Listeria cossartiae subsp. cayugensis]